MEITISSAAVDSSDYRLPNGQMFSEFYAAMFNKTVRIMKKYGLGNDSADAAQEAFLRLHNYRETFNGKSDMKTWFTQICRNLAVDKYRGRKRRPLLLTEDVEIDFDDIPGFRQDSYEKQFSLDQEESRKRIFLASRVNALPENQREVMQLYLGEMKYTEMAEALNWPLGTVKSRLSRAIDNVTNVTVS